MKTWRKKVLIPKLGECSVKEARDNECGHEIAPISHGFVNLFRDNVWIGFCGVLYAKERIIK